MLCVARSFFCGCLIVAAAAMLVLTFVLPITNVHRYRMIQRESSPKQQQLMALVFFQGLVLQIFSSRFQKQQRGNCGCR
jgi:hypothetical protein